MSYILDALRKADAERELGNVPSLHARPVVWPDDEALANDSDGRRPGRDQDDERRGEGRPPRVGRLGLLGALSGLVGLTAFVLAAWMWWTGGPARGVAASPASVSVPPVSQTPAPDLSAPTAAPTATAVAPAVSMVAPVEPVAPPRVQPVARPAKPVASAVPAAPIKPAIQSQPARAAVPAAAAPPTARLPLFQDLPADARSGVPALVVNGSVYSQDPSSRVLMVNGQVLREGDSLGGDAVIETIRQKSAVVRVRDQRALITW